MPFNHFFPRQNASHYLVMHPLSLKSSYDGITALKQSSNRAIILANTLCYAPHARRSFPTSQKRSISSFKGLHSTHPCQQDSALLMHIELQMDQFKLLSVKVVHSSLTSLRVLYNQNSYKDMEIKNLVPFFKQPSSGQCTSATIAPSDFSLSPVL